MELYRLSSTQQDSPHGIQSWLAQHLDPVIRQLSMDDRTWVKNVAVDSPFFDILSWHPMLASEITGSCMDRVRAAISEAAGLCGIGGGSEAVGTESAAALDAVCFSLAAFACVSDASAQSSSSTEPVQQGLFISSLCGLLAAIADACPTMGDQCACKVVHIATNLLCLLPIPQARQELDKLSTGQLDVLVARCLWVTSVVDLMLTDVADILAALWPRLSVCAARGLDISNGASSAAAMMTALAYVKTDVLSMVTVLTRRPPASASVFQQRAATVAAGIMGYNCCARLDPRVSPQQLSAHLEQHKGALWQALKDISGQTGKHHYGM